MGVRARNSRPGEEKGGRLSLPAKTSSVPSTSSHSFTLSLPPSLLLKSTSGGTYSLVYILPSPSIHTHPYPKCPHKNCRRSSPPHDGKQMASRRKSEPSAKLSLTPLVSAVHVMLRWTVCVSVPFADCFFHCRASTGLFCNSQFAAWLQKVRTPRSIVRLRC